MSRRPGRGPAARPRPTRARHSVAVLALLLMVAGIAGCSPEPAEQIPGVRLGVSLDDPAGRPPAPTVAAPVLGGDGELSVADFRGQVLVVNFWASWCGPCRAEQPDLNDAYDRVAGPDVAFLGVNIDDTTANATAHVREFDIPYPSLFDPSLAYAARYEGVGPRAIPSTIIIDSEGRVAARLYGTTTTVEVVTLVERLVAEAA